MDTNNIGTPRTEAEIDALSPGRKLDILVLGACMGYRIVNIPGLKPFIAPDGRGYGFETLPAPSTDTVAASAVAEAYDLSPTMSPEWICKTALKTELVRLGRELAA